MIELTVRTDIEIDATADAGWKLLGEGFGEWDTWSPGIDKVTMKGPLAQGVIRVNETPSLGTVTQELVRFERAERALAYEVREGLPPFLRAMRNDWQIDPLGDGRSRLSGVAVFGLPDALAPKKAGIQAKMTEVLKQFCAAFQGAVESRNPAGALKPSQPAV